MNFALHCNRTASNIHAEMRLTRIRTSQEIRKALFLNICNTIKGYTILLGRIQVLVLNLLDLARTPYKRLSNKALIDTTVESVSTWIFLSFVNGRIQKWEFCSFSDGTFSHRQIGVIYERAFLTESLVRFLYHSDCEFSLVTFGRSLPWLAWPSLWYMFELLSVSYKLHTLLAVPVFNEGPVFGK